MLVLVSYDVAMQDERGPKRLRRVAKTCQDYGCRLYTSDAADDLLCVDLGGRRIIKNKKNIFINSHNSCTAHIPHNSLRHKHIKY